LERLLGGWSFVKEGNGIIMFVVVVEVEAATEAAGGWSVEMDPGAAVSAESEAAEGRNQNDMTEEKNEKLPHRRPAVGTRYAHSNRTVGTNDTSLFPPTSRVSGKNHPP
jgi:hypothetical protein